MVKNKIYNFPLLKNAILVRGMDLNLASTLIDVLTVGEMVEFEQIKDFLLYNKLVHNVLVVEKKLQTLVVIVMDREINRPQKNYL